MSKTLFSAHVNYKSRHDLPDIQNGSRPRDYTLQIEHSTAELTYDSDVPKHTEVFRIRAHDANGHVIRCDGTNRTVFEYDMAGVKGLLHDDRSGKEGMYDRYGNNPGSRQSLTHAYEGGKGFFITKQSGSSRPYMQPDTDGYIEMRFMPDDGKPLAPERIKQIATQIAGTAVEQVRDFPNTIAPRSTNFAQNL